MSGLFIFMSFLMSFSYFHSIFKIELISEISKSGLLFPPLYPKCKLKLYLAGSGLYFI